MAPLLAACILFLVSLNGGEGLSYRDDVEFLQWSSVYVEGKRDLAEIYSTWRRNAEFVREQNSLVSYNLVMNKFGHLNVDQLVRKTTAINFREDTHSKQDEASELNDVKSIPPSVDWRTKGIVPPVRNQGQIGDAFAFGVVGAIDSLHAMETGQLVLASEEEFDDCCGNSSSGGHIYDPLGAFKCVTDIGGLAGENYHSPNHTCLNNTYPPVAKIHGGKMVPRGNEMALAAAVAMQPVVAAIDASHSSFQFYSSGVYDEPSCSSTQLDHTVLVVGYGSEDGKDYWIVQNSWGAEWGMQGYILMSRNKNNQCGIATNAAYPN